MARYARRTGPRRRGQIMLDRAKYVTLVVSLYLVTIVVIVSVVGAIFERPLLDVTVNLAPAILICLLGVVIHGLRHGLDS
ncbi:MAG: hypothetical protein ACTHVK_09975 [Brachybacterium sp.]